MSLFPLAIITLFWKLEIGLSIAQIMVLQACFGLALALCEFPSGYVADRIGYRVALVIASILGFIGWSLYIVADHFWSVLAAELILGVGHSLISGTDSAMMFESLANTGKQQTFEKWNGRLRFWGQSAEATTALVAGMLFTLWARLPFVLQSLVWLINIAIALTLVEPQRHRPIQTPHWQQIKDMCHYIIKRQPPLLALMIFSLPIGLGSFIPVWLIPLHAHDSGVPASWLGPIWAVANYTVALAALSSFRLRSWCGQLPTLLLCIAMMAIGYLGLGLSYHVFGFAFYFVITIMRGINSPIIHGIEQHLLPSDNRAGLLSLRSLVFRVAFALVGPSVGVAVDHWGQHAIFLGVGGVLSLASVMAWLWLGRALRSPMPVPNQLTSSPDSGTPLDSSETAG